jgi:hypothetical protein
MASTTPAMSSTSPISSLRTLPSQRHHYARATSDSSEAESIPTLPIQKPDPEPETESKVDVKPATEPEEEAEKEDENDNEKEDDTTVKAEDEGKEVDTTLEPFSGLEVVEVSDEKMIALPDISEYSTLELTATLFPSYGKDPFDFHHQDYSTLEIPTSMDLPTSPMSNYPSLRRRSSMPSRSGSRSSSVLDNPLPPLPSIPNKPLGPHRKASEQTLGTLHRSNQSVRSHISLLQTPRRIKECGVWFDRRFYAGEGGMEIWMSRNRTWVRDMRWEVICGSSRVLAIRGNPNSWGEKREFCDTRGNLLFKTRKQGGKGKRRVAVSKQGQVVFAVSRDPDTCKSTNSLSWYRRLIAIVNASWTVEFTNARDKRTVKWNVRGSASTNDVYVNVSKRRSVL